MGTAILVEWADRKTPPTNAKQLVIALTRFASSRGDRTAIELFCQGMASWDASLRRRVDDGKSKPD
jgi:hypothetical protein